MRFLFSCVAVTATILLLSFETVDALEGMTSEVVNSIVESGRFKRSVGIEQCVERMQACEAQAADPMRGIGNKKEFQKECRNALPQLHCVNRAFEQCRDPIAKILKDVFTQLIDGIVAMCDDPKIARIMEKPETERCFKDSNASFKTCAKQYPLHGARICCQQARLFECFERNASTRCSRTSKQDAAYVMKVMLSGFTKGKGCERTTVAQC